MIPLRGSQSSSLDYRFPSDSCGCDLDADLFSGFHGTVSSSFSFRIVWTNFPTSFVVATADVLALCSSSMAVVVGSHQDHPYLYVSRYFPEDWIAGIVGEERPSAVGSHGRFFLWAVGLGPSLAVSFPH
ncbi:hypothetical protein ACJJTC_018786 [Scirpophaga incertulas]